MEYLYSEEKVQYIQTIAVLIEKFSSFSKNLVCYEDVMFLVYYIGIAFTYIYLIQWERIRCGINCDFDLSNKQTHIDVI